MKSILLSQFTLEGLAPANLPQRTQVRYDGAGISARLADFSTQDADRLGAIYRALMVLSGVLRTATEEELLPAGIQALQKRKEWEEIFEMVRALGGGQVQAKMQARILHDIREEVFS